MLWELLSSHGCGDIIGELIAKKGEGEVKAKSDDDYNDWLLNQRERVD